MLDMWDGERNDIEMSRDANFRIGVTGTLTWAKTSEYGFAII